jgi:adenine-specific DNA methylase
MPAFIETQFPIARLSAESYRERKAVAGQTLTGLGKWWGRKPLILVRAAIVGMLMPASADAQKDRDVFLRILTMDDDGARQRCKPEEARQLGRQRLQASPMAELADLLRATERAKRDTDDLLARLNSHFDTRAESLSELQLALGERAFGGMTYAERIAMCARPENVSGPSAEAWQAINEHLGTHAASLSALVLELGERQFGRRPRVGDSFCGGGSIPFEAARIGCDAFGSDLNPAAGLLTWASLNLLGGGADMARDTQRMQAAALAAVDKQITDWGIEHNANGERADAYLYCVEVKPEGCDYYIPLSPTWTVADKSRVVVEWHREDGSDRLRPEVRSVDAAEYERYKNRRGATVTDSRVVDPFDPARSWSLEAIRGPQGLRRWTSDDLQPRSDDVLQERLYCIRWVDADGQRRYAAPDPDDLEREARVSDLLRERLASWQHEGFIPSKAIPSGGDKTEEPIRTRGWTHWHHLFAPRQLLLNGLLMEIGAGTFRRQHEAAALLLSAGRVANWNSRLCRWLQTQGGGIGGGKDTFSNQALNTLYNFSVRPFLSLKGAAEIQWAPVKTEVSGRVVLSDARDVEVDCDLWITDPPYADAINYHELGDFFLAWYDKLLSRAFTDWTSDGRIELAVRGDGDDFRRSMVEVYENLTRHMPDNGLQMVMFTHQNPAVWADLGMILWASGLKATAAWTISTETESAGIKKGNYVQGTVCLVLRKRIGSEPGFLDEVYPLVEDEVKRQIASMQALDESGEPNFNDADYQLAAYAAALKVLTRYGNLDGRDVEHELFAVRAKGEKSDFQVVIERALMIACDALIPRGLETSWRDLGLAERYYLRALDIESRGERRQGMYEELARGFGVTDIKPLLKSDKANGARMHTASGLGAATLGDSGASGAAGQTASGRRGRASAGAPHPFASAPLRQLLFAVRETALGDHSPEAGRQYLRDTYGQGYWSQRERFVALLEWLSRLGDTAGMDEWTDDSRAARILAGRLRNDHA